ACSSPPKMPSKAVKRGTGTLPSRQIMAATNQAKTPRTPKYRGLIKRMDSSSHITRHARSRCAYPLYKLLPRTARESRLQFTGLRYIEFCPDFMRPPTFHNRNLPFLNIEEEPFLTSLDDTILLIAAPCKLPGEQRFS